MNTYYIEDFLRLLPGGGSVKAKRPDKKKLSTVSALVQKLHKSHYRESFLRIRAVGLEIRQFARVCV
jgi:hypothetical protein